MKKFRLLFALGFLVLSQAAYSGADTAPEPVVQPQSGLTYRELVCQAQITTDSRVAAQVYLRAAETAPDNEQRYWSLVEAGKQLHQAKDYPQAIEIFTRAEKLDGIIDLARFDAGLNAAYSVLAQINNSLDKPRRDFAPAYTAFRRLFTLPNLEPWPRKLTHAGVATVYSDDGKHLEAALEFEKGEKAYAATDSGYYTSAYEELERLKPTPAALAAIDRMAAQVGKRKIYDSQKQVYRSKTAAELNADKLRWAKLKKRHSQRKP